MKAIKKVAIVVVVILLCIFVGGIIGRSVTGEWNPVKWGTPGDSFGPADPDDTQGGQNPTDEIDSLVKQMGVGQSIVVDGNGNYVLANTGCVAFGSGNLGYGPDGEVCCIGYVQYFRTGLKSGYLNLSISLLNVHGVDYYQYLDMNCISDVIGVSLTKPSDLSCGQATGVWVPISTKADLVMGSGYGATCVFNEPGYICLARIYREDSFISGAWQINFLDALDDEWSTFVLMGIEVEETQSVSISDFVS